MVYYMRGTGTHQDRVRRMSARDTKRYHPYALRRAHVLCPVTHIAGDRRIHAKLQTQCPQLTHLFAAIACYVGETDMEPVLQAPSLDFVSRVAAECEHLHPDGLQMLERCRNV